MDACGGTGRGGFVDGVCVCGLWQCVVMYVGVTVTVAMRGSGVQIGGYSAC